MISGEVSGSGASAVRSWVARNDVRLFFLGSFVFSWAI